MKWNFSIQNSWFIMWSIGYIGEWSDHPEEPWKTEGFLFVASFLLVIKEPEFWTSKIFYCLNVLLFFLLTLHFMSLTSYFTYSMQSALVISLWLNMARLVHSTLIWVRKQSHNLFLTVLFQYFISYFRKK